MAHIPFKEWDVAKHVIIVPNEQFLNNIFWKFQKVSYPLPPCLKFAFTSYLKIYNHNNTMQNSRPDLS